jgi:deoxyribonuclease-4
LDGCINPAAFGRIIRHPAMSGIPIVLETPQDEAGYAAEIAWLREQYN